MSEAPGRARPSRLSERRWCGGHRHGRQSGPAPDEDFYSNIINWRDYDGYTERERIAIEYAEGMGLTPRELAADEDFWSRARAAFTDDEIVDLTYAIAAWMGLGRATHVLGLDGTCSWMPDPAQVS